MSALDSVVQVVIYDQTNAISTASFQIPLVLAEFTNFSERTRTYTSMTGVAEDFDSTDKAYKFASQLFGQSGVLGAVPPSIVIGRRQVDSVTGSIATVANTTAYTVTINGTDFTYTSDSDATAIEIVAGLKAAYDLASISGVTFTDNLDGTFAVAVVTIGTAWSIVASSNVALTHVTPTETWVEALDAVDQENDTWYAVVAETQTVAEQEALSDAIQSREKIYGLSSADVVAPTTGTTDIGYKLNAKSAGRTFGVYSPTAATEYPEAAWVGSQLAVTPGSNDWDYKQANGVTSSKLTSTQLVNLNAKSWNYYTTLNSVGIFRNGNMFDGTPLDLVVGKDWLKARIQEAIYGRMINTLKIPFTDGGMVIIENEIRSVLALAESNGLIAKGWSVQTPAVSSIPATLRAQRAAGVFVIRATVQGAVRSVSVEIYLSV